MEATEDREPQGILLTSTCLIQISPSLVHVLQLAVGVLLIAFILHCGLWIGFKVVLFCLHNVLKLNMSMNFFSSSTFVVWSQVDPLLPPLSIIHQVLVYDK